MACTVRSRDPTRQEERSEMGLDLRHTFEWTAHRGAEGETFGRTTTRGTVEEIEDRDQMAVLLGEPYDGGTVGRRGAREGPRAVRTELSETTTHHLDAGPVGSVLDLGDVAVRGRFDGNYRNSTATVQDRVAEVTRRVHDLPTLPVFVGGSNAVTVANVRPLLSGEDDVGVVSFDAHLNCRAGGRPADDTSHRQLLEAGVDELSVVGARHFETSTAAHDRLRERDATVVTAEECEDPIAAVDRALPDTERLYVSVDLDVLDDATAPGVPSPSPGGLVTRELYRMLRLATGDDRLAGVEVIGCTPRHDEADRTARAGARAIAHALAGHDGG